MIKTELSPTNTGLDLVRKLMNARRRLENAESERSSASCQVSNAESDLVKWLVPSDAKIGEVFCVPVGTAFLEVRITQSNARAVGTGERSKEKEYQVEWRGSRPPKDPL